MPITQKTHIETTLYDNGTDKIERHGVRTEAEALSVMRKASRFYVRVRADAYIDGDTEHYKPGYYRASVGVTKAHAEKMIADMFANKGIGAEYMQLSLSYYATSGRMNPRTYKMGKPRIRVSCFIG